MAKTKKLSSPSIKEDRIGGLPDELLIDILSHLNIRQVAQSCLLSKRWRNLWSSVRNLNIEDMMCDNTVLQRFFPCFSALRIPKTDCFRISCDSFPFLIDVQNWIHGLPLPETGVNNYPKVIIENMTKLLTGSLVPYGRTTTLELTSVVLPSSYYVPGELALNFNQYLENLIIRNCSHVNITCLRIRAHGLKKLIVENNAEEGNNESCVFTLRNSFSFPERAEFSGDLLTKVEFKGYMYRDYYFESKLPNLLTAHLDTQVTNKRIRNELELQLQLDEEAGLGKSLANILRGLSNATDLTISADGLRVAAGQFWKQQFDMFHKLKHVKLLNVEGRDSEIELFQLLLKNPLVLEKLVVEVKEDIERKVLDFVCSNFGDFCQLWQIDLTSERRANRSNVRSMN